MPPPTVLIVDDEAEIRELVAIYLQSDGLHTLQAASGDEALQLLQEHEVQVVVLDIMLDDMDGYNVCRRIRAQYTMPILFLSAKQSELDKITGLTLGGDDFITKPFGSLELLACVKAQLRRYTTYNAAAPHVGGHGRRLAHRHGSAPGHGGRPAGAAHAQGV